MNGVTSGQGGAARPHEYFDLIGSSGLSGLCALLFVRFVGPLRTDEPGKSYNIFRATPWTKPLNFSSHS